MNLMQKLLVIRRAADIWQRWQRREVTTAQRNALLLPLLCAVPTYAVVGVIGRTTPRAEIEHLIRAAIDQHDYRQREHWKTKGGAP